MEKSNFKFANEHRKKNPLLMLVTTLPGITGLLLVASLIFIVSFASKPIRRQDHSRFWATHHMFVVYYVLLFLHAMDGVLKYQVNLSEHVPGCLMVIETNKSQSDNSYPISFPEPHAEPHAEPHPEPHPEPYAFMSFQAKQNKTSQAQKSFRIRSKTLMKTKKMNKDKTETYLKTDNLLQVVMPEPEPLTLSGRGEQTAELFNNSLRIQMVRINGKWMSAVACKQPPPKFVPCPKEVWKWLFVPLSLYLLERVMRMFYLSRYPAKIEGFQFHPDNVIELKLSLNGFKAKPGQTILIRSPDISSVELHPFSLTNVPSLQDKTFGVHIKVVGDWTEKLAEILRRNQLNDSQSFKNSNTFSHFSNKLDSKIDSCIVENKHVSSQSTQRNSPNNCVQSNQKERSEQYSKDNNKSSPHTISYCYTCKEPTLSTADKYETRPEFLQLLPEKRGQNLSLFIEGPLGSSMEDIFKYKTALCVAGGIGVTPFASVLNKILVTEDIFKTTKLNRLYLIWSCKTLTSFQWFINVIEKLHLKLWQENRPDFFSVQLYLTSGEKNDLLESGLSSVSVLKRCTLHFHRPRIHEIINDISNRHKRCTVGVFTCGPRSLMTSVSRSCSRSPPNDKTTFIFNKEAF